MRPSTLLAICVAVFVGIGTPMFMMGSWGL